MSKADGYRNLAREARAMADRLRYGDSREKLLRMVEDWEKLAGDCDRQSTRAAAEYY